MLGLTVDAAAEFFADAPHLARSLYVLRQVGLGYLRLGQPATELSGGEAQRIKLATELQRPSRGSTLHRGHEKPFLLGSLDQSERAHRLASLIVFPGIQ